MVSDNLVIDASAWVDLLMRNPSGRWVRERIAGQVLHAPAHLDIEMLSALGRMHRAGSLADTEVADHLRTAARAPIHRHALPDLTEAAWSRRHSLRISDAYYVELATRLEVPLIATDRRLARAAPIAEAPPG